MQSQDLKKFKIPDKPGIYFFKKGKRILYIGKATSLKDRTKSYFGKDLIETRGPAILDMVVQADKLDWHMTDSVLEALILEAELIKKYQPKYNVKEKDDKSWNYVCITKEDLSKVVLIRGKDLIKENYRAIYGPFTNGLQLKEALKIIRRMFPFIDGESIKKNNREFYRQLGLTPEGVKEYKENIKNIKLFFEGKKKKIIQGLKKQMLTYAKVREFEKANEIKKRIFALEHINDIALIKQTEESSFNRSTSSNFSSLRPSRDYTSGTLGKLKIQRSFTRIEAYDVAHISGKNMVGVMTVIGNGELAKKEYKKFIIKTQNGANDTGALEEILSRRFRHTEWGIPDLVVVDGSIAQINVAKSVLDRYQFKISIVGVVKDERHKAKAIQGDEAIIKKYKGQILLANSEAHRFAIKFYRAKSRKNMFSRV